jgi:hypothetical protein
VDDDRGVGLGGEDGDAHNPTTVVVVVVIVVLVVMTKVKLHVLLFREPW